MLKPASSPTPMLSPRPKKSSPVPPLHLSLPKRLALSSSSRKTAVLRAPLKSPTSATSSSRSSGSRSMLLYSKNSLLGRTASALSRKCLFGLKTRCPAVKSMAHGLPRLTKPPPRLLLPPPPRRPLLVLPPPLPSKQHHNMHLKHQTSKMNLYIRSPVLFDINPGHCWYCHRHCQV